MNAYEAYGALAAKLRSPLAVSARYSFQADEISCVVTDIIAKLAPGPTDRLLEVGCNVGLLLTPLAGLVAEAVGIDHPRVLERYRESGLPANVTLLPGQWPSVRPDGNFDLILAYAVLHYLPGLDEACQFIEACQQALRPGGRLLIGDLPNRDAKSRFLGAPGGREFAAEWERKKAPGNQEDAVFTELIDRADPAPLGAVDDRFVLGVLAAARQAGFESYVLPQPSHLPFGQTREDVLIRRRL